MRRGITVLLTVSGLALVACGSRGVAPSTATPATTRASVVPATPSMARSTAAETGPTVEKRTVTKTRTIPFATRRVNTPTLAKGTTKVRTCGVPGIEILSYEVTFTNGVKTGQKLIDVVIVKAPVTRVIEVGTKVTPQCDPNYSGACVPVASDVDCAGGSGNGPAYVQGPVRVVGKDIYGLDRDGDGIGCES